MWTGIRHSIWVLCRKALGVYSYVFLAWQSFVPNEPMFPGLLTRMNAMINDANLGNILGTVVWFVLGTVLLFGESIGNLVKRVRAGRAPQNSTPTASPATRDSLPNTLSEVYVQSDIHAVQFRHIWDNSANNLSPDPYLEITLQVTNGTIWPMRITHVSGRPTIEGNLCGTDARLPVMLVAPGISGKGTFTITFEQRITDGMAQIMWSKMLKQELIDFNIGSIALDVAIDLPNGRTLTGKMAAADNAFEVDSNGLNPSRSGSQRTHTRLIAN